MQAFWRRGNIPAAIALVVMLAAGVFADYQNSVVFEQNQRADVLARLNVIRARLEGNVSGNIQLVRGLMSVIITEPNMTQPRFSALSANLFQQHSQLRSVAAAPGLIVDMVYPYRDNAAAIGLDYRTNVAQREAALRARDTGEMVLAGPVDLVQGGRGFVGRFPVFVFSDDGRKRFWGLLSAVIDVERLYKDSGLVDETAIDIAISGSDATGALGRLFYGDQSILASEPATADVILPSGSWRLAAVPTGGWQATPSNAWFLRIAMAVAGVLVLVPIFLSGRLLDERRGHIDTLRRREQEVQRVSRRLALALRTSQVGVWEYDLESGDLTWDDNVHSIFGLPVGDRTRRYTHWRNCVHPDDRERAEVEFSDAVNVTGSYRSDYRIILPDGTVRHIRAIASVYHDAGETAKIVGVNWDVTADIERNAELQQASLQAEARNRELELAKASIEYNSLHDSLTGLPNRRYLDQALRQRASSTRREGGSVSLLHIDLDRFKQINDTLGHAAGDAMLIHAAAVLKQKVREDDFVARVGGDEFVVLCNSRGRARDLSRLAERIVAAMREPVVYQGHECRFGVSVGIATESGVSIDPQRLMINADIALYRAKSRGRNRFEFFSDALQAEIVNTKRVADDILSGLERKEFVAFYQPQFDARTLSLTGLEALARWQHPQAGLLTPDKFLRIAEDLNVLATIDRMILDQALDFRKGWNSAHGTAPHVSVNVSARRLHDEGLIASLKGLDIPQGTVSFELLESIYLDESDEIVGWNIDQIKELGIDIEIDDFGTGYASIVSLLKLKPRRLKIDRQLVVPIVSSVSQRHLVESIIEIGQSLGIEVVAEGVETMEHARILKDLNCDVLQGYAFGRPMPADEIVRFTMAESWRKAS